MTGAPVMSSTDEITGDAPSTATPSAADIAMMQTLLRLTDLFTPSAVRAGATHGLFTALLSGSTPAEIVTKKGLDAEYLDILIDFYDEVGILTRQGGLITLTAVGEALSTAESALTMRGMFGQTARSMIGMDHTLATGEIATRGVFGTDFWTALSATDPDGETIAREMSATGVDDYDSDLVRDTVDWSNVGTIVDLGGGRGDLLAKLLTALPDARGTVLEYGRMADVARAHLAATPLASRIDVRAGSFLEPIDTRADVFVLSGILADWHDEDALTILTHARVAAAASGGRVVLAEIALRATSARERLYHRTVVSRPVREADELVDLATRAGFARTVVLAATSRRSVLELTP